MMLKRSSVPFWSSLKSLAMSVWVGWVMLDAPVLSWTSDEPSAAASAALISAVSCSMHEWNAASSFSRRNSLTAVTASSTSLAASSPTIGIILASFDSLRPALVSVTNLSRLLRLPLCRLVAVACHSWVNAVTAFWRASDSASV
jgi:hypothetical protein